MITCRHFVFVARCLKKSGANISNLPWSEIRTIERKANIFWNNRKVSEHTKEDINEYLLHKIRPFLLTNWYLYALRDEVLVDHFIRYEELESDLRATLDRLNIREPLALPDAKAGVRPRETCYRDIISPAARAHIEKSAKVELDYFGYEW